MAILEPSKETVESENGDADIFFDAKQYSFFQINQLLHRYLDNKNLDNKNLDTKNLDSRITSRRGVGIVADKEGIKRGFSQSRKNHTVRYKANASLSFPSSDIQSIGLWQENDKEFADVTVNFMGLFGPASPLPAFFTERILHAEADDTSVRDFLDVFNHRVLDLLQRVWEKYRYYQCYDRGNDDFSQWMFSLVGISHIELCEYGDLSWSRLMPYAGLIALKVTNVEKMTKVIEGYFGIENVEIDQCVQRDVKICADQLNQMGITNCGMGNDLVLGDSVLDRMGKFRLNLFDLTVEQFNQFLPGGTMNKSLRQLVKFLMTDQFDVEIRLQAKGRSHLHSSMDGDNFMMGWNSCLGGPVEQETYDAII